MSFNPRRRNLPHRLPIPAVRPTVAAVAVTKAIKTSIHRQVGKVAAAVKDDATVRRGPFAAQRTAIGDIAKPTSDAQLGVDGEQQRQAHGGARVDVLLAASMPPAASQADVALLAARHHSSRGVMHKAAKCARAKRVVILGVQDELVPQIVHHLRRHRHVLSTTF